MTIDQLNDLSSDDAYDALERCCGASRWIADVLALRPFSNGVALHAAADQAWATMSRDDILEAFSHHPQIGADLKSLRKKFAATSTWSASEQAGISTADEATLLGLADGNWQYLAKFGYPFIVCATGRSAAEMLAALRIRLPNDPEIELKISAAEQAKIMHIRLNKLLEVQSAP